MIKLLLLFAVFSSNTVFADVCKYKNEKYIGNRCYSFVAKKHTYNSAEHYCKSEGYNLATVDNAIIDNFLASHAAAEFGKTTGEFWIGLHRKYDFSLFEWEDGTPVAFTNFDSGFPSYTNHVTEELKNGRWKTHLDTAIFPFICSYVPQQTTTTTTTKKATTTGRITTTTARATTKKAPTVATVTPTPSRTTRTTKTTTTVRTTTKRRGCPEGFTLFQQDNRCYIVLVYGNDADYPSVPDNAPPLTREAQRCSKYGAQLATIHSSDLNDLIRSLIYDRFNDPRYATIGLRNNDETVSGGKWTWYDNSKLDFIDFGDGFPKTGDSIAQASTNGNWVTFTHTAPSEGVVCYVNF